ncbi:MAG TPA: hypothetical protein VLM05_11870, partial [Mycobacteriales bacterium]|nr:hypothetical protein [Mycobacteriales bacterium]
KGMVVQVLVGARFGGTFQPTGTSQPTGAAQSGGIPRRAGTPESAGTAQPTGAAHPSGAAEPSGTAQPGGELPRRQPGSHPLRPAAKTPPRTAPAPVDPEQTVEIPRPLLGTGPGKPAAHPAADERAYSRLDEVTAQAATAVAAGTLDFRHAVARIAMAAPGRVDLLDRVIEVERRLAGVQIGTAAPTETVLRLLAAARRVVAGEVALVDPSGVRVEQTAQVLRLVRPDRTTRECRNAKELSRHVDLSTLTTDVPAS